MPQSECGRVEKRNESRRRRGIVRPAPFPNLFSRKISGLSSDSSELTYSQFQSTLRGHVLERDDIANRIEPCDKKTS